VTFRGSSEDFREGVEAFGAKHKPRFRGNDAWRGDSRSLRGVAADGGLGKSHRCPWGILPTSARPNRGAKRYLSAALFPSHTVIFNNGGSPPSITKCDGRMLKKRDELRPILGPALCGQVEPDRAEMAAEFVSGTRPHTAGPQMA
jgi:hypothetical protein